MSTLETGAVDLDGLFEAQWRPLVRLAVFLVDDRETAEDVVQNAFIGLHQKQHQLRNPEAALAYLRTSTVNGSRSVLRKRAVRRRDAQRNELHENLAVEDPSIAHADNADLLAAVRNLPRRQREVVVLRYWSDLTDREVAQALSVSLGTVKSTASRALDTLEHVLGEAQ